MAWIIDTDKEPRGVTVWLSSTDSPRAMENVTDVAMVENTIPIGLFLDADRVRVYMDDLTALRIISQLLHVVDRRHPPEQLLRLNANTEPRADLDPPELPTADPRRFQS